MNLGVRLCSERLTTTAALVLLCGALFVTPRVEAQQTHDDAPLSSIDDDALLSSINTESDWATALYVSSVSSMVVGASVGIPAFLGAAFSCIDCTGVNAPFAVFVASFAVFSVGLLALPFAIALDVDSGSRRGGLARQSVRLIPGPFGLSMEGTF